MLRRHLSPMLLLGLCLVTFVGCAEAPATVSPDQVAPAKPGMARVWFFRGALTPQLGAVTAFSPQIYANGAAIAAIAPGTTFYRDFTPGTYRFTVQPLGLPTPQAATLQLTPGTQYYLQVDWIQSWTQGYPPASWSFAPNTFGILQMNPQVAQAYIPTLAYLGERGDRRALMRLGSVEKFFGDLRGCGWGPGKDVAEAQRASVVATAARSPAAITKLTTGQTEDGLPVHSFRTLLADLATLTRNTLVTAIDPERSFTLWARPTALQQKALDLLGLTRTQ